MFTTIAASTDTQSIELWKGLYKTIDPLDEKVNFHNNIFTTIPTQLNNESSEEHPLLQKLSKMKETEGEMQKMNIHLTPQQKPPQSLRETEIHMITIPSTSFHQLETKSELKEKVNNQISIIHLIHQQYIWIPHKTNHLAAVQDLGGNHPTKSRTC